MIVNLARRIQNVYNILTPEQKERLADEEKKVTKVLEDFLKYVKLNSGKEPTLKELKVIASENGIPYASRSNTIILLSLLEKKNVNVMEETVKLRKRHDK